MLNSDFKGRHKLYIVINQYKHVEFSMMKSYNFRIYPNKNQTVRLISTLNTCRHLYNDSLAERKHQAEINRIYQDFQVFPWGGKPEWINYYDQAADLTRNKNEYQKEVYSQVLQNVLKRVERSFKNFFRGAGYPRFQGRNRYDSFTYPQKGFEITDDGKLKLSKIGELRIFQHREIECNIKTCTIKRDVDQWYVIFACEVEPTVLSKTNKSIGIDVGLKSLITDSDGNQIKPEKYYRQAEENLIKAHRDLSRKKKGSSNRNKQRIKVAKIHRHIRNQRKDFNHKLSRNLVNNYDTIVFEKLQITNMIKNQHLAKSINDAGWGQLIEYTKFKAEYAGRVVQLVNPRNTSQNCSSCGTKVKKSLSVRIHKCPVCGLTIDRDRNAAINILQKSVGTDCTELTPVEMFNRTSLKQEALLF